MASPLEVQLILCDAAQADPSGKMHMLGAGWSTTGTPTTHAVAVLVKVPWDRANQRLHLTLELLTTDGKPVEFDTPTGKAAVRAEGEVEVGRPPGVPHGSMLPASFALNVAPLPLPPGRYDWHLTLAEAEQAAAFTVLG